MNGKLSAQHELFAIALVSGMTQTDAYRKAYPKSMARPHTIEVEASRIAARPDVRARIDELRAPIIAKAQKKFDFTLEQAFEEIEQAEAQAERLGQPSVRLAATKLKAQLKKMLVSVSETRPSVLDDVSTEELNELLAMIRAKKEKEASEEKSGDEKKLRVLAGGKR